MITIVFLNIVFGIIIDTFAELRDEKHAMIVDMNSKCMLFNLLLFRLYLWVRQVSI
jgi:hypothetical protein